jgi:hypothetical protein
MTQTPPGLATLFPLSPALKRRAVGVRPSGTGFSEVAHNCIPSKLVLTHTLKRWAIIFGPCWAGFLQTLVHHMPRQMSFVTASEAPGYERSSLCRAFACAPLGLVVVRLPTRGLRRGLHSCAATRLDNILTRDTEKESSEAAA